MRNIIPVDTQMKIYDALIYLMLPVIGVAGVLLIASLLFPGIWPLGIVDWLSIYISVPVAYMAIKRYRPKLYNKRDTAIVWGYTIIFGMVIIALAALGKISLSGTTPAQYFVLVLGVLVFLFEMREMTAEIYKP